MTNEEKIEFLRQYRENGCEIERVRMEIAKWESLACRVTASFGVARGGNGEDRLQCAVEKIDALKNELIDQVGERIALRRWIGGTIASLPDESLRRLLCYRYIDCLTWEQIAERMHYSVMQVHRLHRKALDLLIL